ncbi:MAG: hypothetical protein KC492_40485, partial [Myxococcales bacterium]|nr:hypothetical protein [Myxococcales bacterium]
GGVALKTPEGVEFKHFELVQEGDALFVASGEKRWRVELARSGPRTVSIGSELGSADLRQLP